MCMLGACAPMPPDNPKNICSIFKQYPKWYEDAKASARKWGTPISVQMAIMKQESHFVHNARPPRTKLLGFIPWSRPTTAYGYAQATEGSWKHYEQSTRQHGADPDDFSDAIDFIGWYTQRAHRYLGLSTRNAYGLYLAYHEGLGGYKNRSYRRKGWLMDVARRVERQSLVYRNQLNACQQQLASNHSFWS